MKEYFTFFRSKDSGLFDIIFAEPDMLSARLSLEEKELENTGETK